MKMKIGLFGGTFDPVHRAHCELAHQALKQFELEHLFWIPAAVSPFKKSADVLASPKDRLAMIQLVCEDEPRFEVSDYEINKGGVSYSIDTLRYFQRLFKSAQFFWILGADALRGVSQWKESESLMRDLIFLVAGRGNKVLDMPKELKVLPVEMQAHSTSSSEIKAGLKEGKCWDEMDVRVAQYIRKNQLYGIAQ